MREEQQTLRDQYRRREEIRTILPFGQVRKLRVPNPRPKSPFRHIRDGWCFRT